MTASTAASDQIYFVWDSIKGKLTGSDHLLAYGRHDNLVFVLERSNNSLFGIVAKGNQPAYSVYALLAVTFISHGSRGVLICYYFCFVNCACYMKILGHVFCCHELFRDR